jgi:hypothetical protein
MQPIFLAIQFLLTVSNDSAPPIYPYLIKPLLPEFNIKNFELKVPQKYKDSVLETFSKDCPFCHYKDSMASLIEYKESFHFIDINGDHLPDLIYEGRSGGEGTMVNFYLNRKKRFELIFTDYEKILDLNFLNNKLNAVVIWNYGCCAETVEFERHFQVDPLSFKFNFIVQRAILQGMDVFESHYSKPDGFFSQPVKFRITNQEYALRYSPAISDTVPRDVDIIEKDNKGNIIALYNAGSRGYAWAYKTDETGKTWWLVEMEPAVFLSFSRFWDYDEKLTHYYGWMSSRFLEKLP